MAFTFCSLLSFISVFIAQVVLTHARLTFQFTNGVVRQCEPISISFSGMPENDAQRPTALAILPLGYAPVVFQLPPSAFTTLSVSLSSLELPAGARILATLEANGRILAPVSELMTIATSEDSSCLPNTPVPPKIFSLVDNPSQCQEFTIQYNNTVVNERETPRVTVYKPGGIALRLNSTSIDREEGLAKYTMAISGDKKGILLIDGGNDIRETTSLITVSGDDASSPSDCLQPEREAEAAISIPETAIVSSRAIIIGASAGGGAVLLIALAMTVFILQERRKRRIRRLQALSFDGSRMVQSPMSPYEKAPLPRSPNQPPYSPQAVSRPRPNPPASRGQAGSIVDPTHTPVSANGTWSWVIPKESEWKHPGMVGHRPGRPSIAHSETRNVAPQANYGDDDRLSLNSLDIEGMLNMAAVQSAETRSRKSSVPMLFGSQESGSLLGGHLSPSSQYTSRPRELSPPPNRRELKVNSDIPAGALSATPSLYDSYIEAGDVRPSNANPFMPEETIVIQAGRRYQGPSSPLRMSSVQGGGPGRTPGGSLGLPASPRTVRLAPGRASIAGSSRRSSADWYGVGIAR